MKQEEKENKRNAVPVSSIDLRELSEIFSQEDLYLSIYLPTATKNDRSLNTSYLLSREKDIEKVIGKEITDCFRSTIDMVAKNLEMSPLENEKGHVIYASKCDGFIREFRITAEPERKMVLDSSPYLLPLAKLKDEFEDYGLLLVDSQEARLMIVRSSVLEKEGSVTIDLMNRHKKGGMSQMRFNRLRKGAIQSFIREVIDDLRQVDNLSDLRGMVIAGPGTAKKQLIEELPKEFSHMVIGTIDIGMDTPSGDLLALADSVAAQNEREKEEALVRELKEAIMKGDPASYGLEEIIKALETGRAALILILEGTKIPGWKCENCQNLRANERPPGTCPRCGLNTSDVNVVEEIFELAEKTGAVTEFVKESPFLESIGGIGAILRY